MKKKIIAMLMASVLLVGCGSADNSKASSTEVSTETALASGSGVQTLAQMVPLDLTQASSTVVYSEVYNMMNTPGDYIGKTVKMRGLCGVFTDESTGNVYYSCVIPDATACCSQGIEFITDDGSYPVEGEEFTVEGIFEVYTESDYQYCRLKNAVIS